MKKSSLSENQLSAFSLYAGSILSGISFLMQLFLSSSPDKGEHIFTYYANQILLNSNVSMLSALFSFFGSIAIAFGIFSLNQFIQKKIYKSIDESICFSHCNIIYWFCHLSRT